MNSKLLVIGILLIILVIQLFDFTQEWFNQPKKNKGGLTDEQRKKIAGKTARAAQGALRK